MGVSAAKYWCSSAVSGEAVDSLQESFRGAGYGDLKKEVAEVYCSFAEPFRDAVSTLMKDPDRLDDILGLSYSSGYHEKRTPNGKLEFKVWNLDVDIRNAPFASGEQASARFEADSTILLEVPVSFGGKLLPPMTIKVKTSAGYTPRF
jgi:hypothetical protein